MDELAGTVFTSTERFEGTAAAYQYAKYTGATVDEVSFGADGSYTQVVTYTQNWDAQAKRANRELEDVCKTNIYSGTYSVSISLFGKIKLLLHDTSGEWITRDGSEPVFTRILKLDENSSPVSFSAADSVYLKKTTVQ